MSTERLELQKEKLRECLRSYAHLEARLAHLRNLEVQWAEIWTRSAMPDQVENSARKIHLQINALNEKFASATHDITDADEAIALIARELSSLHSDCLGLNALMLARWSIAKEKIDLKQVSALPEVFSYQLALILFAEEQRNTIHKHLNELSKIRPSVQDGWPEKLDLNLLDASLQDINSKLSTYRGQLANPQKDLAYETLPMLMSMIESMELAIDDIQKCRTNLASNSLLGHVLSFLKKK